MTISRRQVATCALALCTLAIVPGITRIAAQAPATTHASVRPGAGELRLTFLGLAGWEITDGRTVVLVDPYLSLRMLDSTARARKLTPAMTWDMPVPGPDSAAIDARVRDADYILVTHGHIDHAFDAPYIARKRGATVIGSETVTNIARAYGVPDSLLLTVIGGEDYEFGTFSLKVIPNLHTVGRCCNDKRFYGGPNAGTTPRDVKAPVRRRDLQEGGNKAYLLRMAGHQVLVMGSMNYIEREMEGLRPDVAIVGARDSRRNIHDYTGRLMRALGHPALVLPTHHDPGIDHPERAAMVEEGRAFAAEVRAASPRSRVVLPTPFEPIVVPPLR